MKSISFFILFLTLISCESSSEWENVYITSNIHDNFIIRDTTDVNRTITKLSRHLWDGKPHTNNYLLKLGFHLAYNQHYFLALHSFERVLDNENENADALLGKAICLTKMRHYEQGFSNINQSIKLNPNNPESYFWRAYLFPGKSDGLKDLTKAISLEPNNAFYYFYRSQQPKNSKVLLDLTTAIVLDSSNYDYIYFRAQYYYKSKNIEKAICDYDRLIELDPSKGYYLKAMDLQLLNRSDLALKTIESAIKKNVVDGLLLRMQAELYYEKGDFKNSVESYHTAWNLGLENETPTYPSHYFTYLIAKNYAKMNIEDSLAKYIELTIKSDNDYIRDIEKDAIFNKYLINKRFINLLDKYR